MLIGVFFIYSSGVSSTGIVFSNEYIKQIIWSCTGIALIVIIFFINWTRFEDFSLYIYLFFIVLLIATLFFGKVVNGSRSWLGPAGVGIQPSEFAKIGFILYLAYFLKSYKSQNFGLIQFSVGIGITLFPMLLIFLQPDMGTAIVYFPIFLIMCFVAGVKRRYIFFLIISLILLIIFTVLPIWNEYVQIGGGKAARMFQNKVFIRYSFLALILILATSILGLIFIKKRYFYWILYGASILLFSFGAAIAIRMVLKEYQLMRLIVFLNPDIDPQGAGWNIIQSKIAVGSGGLLGKGFLKGTQSHYRFLPQQSTDFIFSIISEEWGFFGGLLIFILFAVLLIRGFIIILNSKDLYAVYVGTGVLTMIFFHVIVNIGMAMGIMPITGIPLFFLSYGGSSLWTVSLGIGLLLSIQRQKSIY